MVNNFSLLFAIRDPSISDPISACRRSLRNVPTKPRVHSVSTRRSTFSTYFRNPLQTFVKRLSLVSVRRYAVWSPRACTCVYDSPGIIQLDLSAFHDINRPCWLSGKCQGDCHRFSDEASILSRQGASLVRLRYIGIDRLLIYTYRVLNCPGKILWENLVNSDITRWKIGRKYK